MASYPLWVHLHVPFSFCILEVFKSPLWHFSKMKPPWSLELLLFFFLLLLLLFLFSYFSSFPPFLSFPSFLFIFLLFFSMDVGKALHPLSVRVFKLLYYDVLFALFVLIFFLFNETASITRLHFHHIIILNG